LRRAGASESRVVCDLSILASETGESLKDPRPRVGTSNTVALLIHVGFIYWAVASVRDLIEDVVIGTPNAALVIVVPERFYGAD